MTNKKSTKSALLASGISLLLCFTMLLGTTFAWFTDSVSTTNNIITAGNLDVELYHKQAKESGWNKVDANTNVFKTNTLWEPGHAEVVNLKIENAGTLALKYQLGVNIASEQDATNVAGNPFKLSDYIKYAVVDGEKTYGSSADAISAAELANPTKLNVAYKTDNIKLESGANIVTVIVYMPTSVGNEANYRGTKIPTINLGINLFATQIDKEADSFGPEYDKDAEYELAVNANGKYETNNIAGLSAAAELASKDTSIDEIVYNGAEVPVVRNDAALDTAIQGGNSVVVLPDGNYILPDSAAGKSLTIVGSGDTVVATQDDGSYEGCDYSLRGATVTFEGIVINTDSRTYTGYAGLSATYNNCTINGAYTLYGESVFNNCEFNVSDDTYNIWTWGARLVKFNNCTFNTDGKSILVYNQSCDVYVNDCVFNDRTNGTKFTKSAFETGVDGVGPVYNIYINNTVVNGFAKNDKCVGYENIVGNKNSMANTHLNIVVDGVDVY